MNVSFLQTLLATLETRLDAVTNRAADGSDLMLSWGNGLFFLANSRRATGFEHATIYTPGESVPRVRNGADQPARVITVAMARGEALRSILETRELLRAEQRKAELAA